MSAADLWQRAQVSGSPLVSDVDPSGLVEVTFVWRGEAERTSVGWGSRFPLTREPGTDLWHGTFRLPARLRSIYFVSHLPDDDFSPPRDTRAVGPAHIDPLNPDTMLFPADPGDPSDRDAYVSRLTLPLAPPETWPVPQPGVPAGTIEEVTLDSGRRVSVHVPAGGRRAGLPALVVFDGYLGRTVMGIPATCDNLIAAGRIPPLVTIFLHGTDDTRDKDLTPDSEETTRFVTRELMPWARRQYGISPYPRDIAVAGASLGGLMAAHVALRAPDVFGAVISQSGSFWWPHPEHGEPEWLTREYARLPRAGLRFYLDVGDRETTSVGPGAPNQIASSRHLRDALRAKGYPVTYTEYPGWHDYVNWRNLFPTALTAIFGRP